MKAYCFIHEFYDIGPLSFVPMGHPPLLLTVVLLRVLRFLLTIPLLCGGMPLRISAVINNSEIKRVTEMDIKKTLKNGNRL